MSTPIRPTSPHLQIYRRTYTMMLSITHRATGLALSAGLVLLTAWLLAVAQGPEHYRHFLTPLGSVPGLVVLAGLAASFCYHFVAGIRHLVFDTGRSLERREARRSAVIVVVASLVLIALVAYAWVNLKGLP
jgi:succinate dehydrogenase / fumarate reductase cytochrome b subunit